MQAAFLWKVLLNQALYNNFCKPWFSHEIIGFGPYPYLRFSLAGIYNKFGTKTAPWCLVLLCQRSRSGASLFFWPASEDQQNKDVKGLGYAPTDNNSSVCLFLLLCVVRLTCIHRARSSELHGNVVAILRYCGAGLGENARVASMQMGGCTS